MGSNPIRATSLERMLGNYPSTTVPAGRPRTSHILRLMEGEQVLVGIAQIGIVIAGFAGLLGSVQDRERWTRAEWVYLQTLVVASIGVVFVALLPFVPFYLWHDQQLSLRIASGLYALYTFQVVPRRLLALRRARAPRSAYANLALAPVLIISAVANVFLGSLALYVFTLLVAIFFATTQFRHFVIPPGKVRGTGNPRHDATSG